MSDDMPEEIYASNDLSNQFWTRDDHQALGNQTKYIRADKVIPEGYALVPIEPTVEMLLAAMTVWEVHNSEFDMDRLEKKYNAMIAAAQEQK